MRIVLITVVLIVTAAGATFAGWWVISRRYIAVPAPTLLLKAEPLRESTAMVVQAGHVSTWTFAPPDGKTPGTLSGTWSSQGKSAGVHGAKDDTLIAFRVNGPNNEVLAQQKDHPTSGNFSFRCLGNGTYTFSFDNSGIIRSSSRNVTVNLTYQPD